MSNLVALYADPSKRTPEVTQAYLDYRAGELDIFGNPRGTPIAQSQANPSSIVTQFQPSPVAAEEPVVSEAPAVSEQTPSVDTAASDSATDINQLYVRTYGRPATPDEIQYHVNRFGSDLDSQEAQSLQTEMTSVPGYTPPTTEGGAVTGTSTEPVEPPSALSSVTSTPAYTTEEKPLGLGGTETIYRDPSGNVITRDQALGLQAEADKQANQPFVPDSASVGFQRYMDILGREPESQSAQEGASGLTREQFFQRAIPELRQTSPVFSTFQQVLGRDPRLSGLDYYRNVRPDLMQDPRAFRRATIESGEFLPRARDLYRQQMGFDPSQQRLSQLIDSGTFLNPDEFGGAIARQNLAMRSRYREPEFTPFMPRAAAMHSRPFPGSRPAFSQPFFSSFQPQPRFTQSFYQPISQSFSQPSPFSFSQPIYTQPSFSQPFFNQYQPPMYSPPQQPFFQTQRQPMGGKGGMGGMQPIRGK
jgi:hypothetical protein